MPLHPKFKNFAVIAAVAAVVFSFFIWQYGRKALEERAFDKAELVFASGDYKRAVVVYDEFTDRFPESQHAPLCLYRIAYIQERMLRSEAAAMDAYSMLLHLYPSSAEAFLARENIASIYSDSGDITRAIAEYSWLAENGPAAKRAGMRYKMALEYEKKNDFRQARVELNELLGSAPPVDMLPQINYEIANTYYLEGNTNEAIAAYDRVIARFGGQQVAVEARLGKAAALEEAGKTSEALVLLAELKNEYSGGGAIDTRINSMRARIRDGLTAPGKRKWGENGPTLVQ